MEQKLIAKRFTLISPLLDERQCRLYVAAEAMVLGRGGISLVSKACGVSRPTITAGCKELASLVADDTAGKTGDSSHPDRNAQFEYIYCTTKEFQVAGHPVISVDTKKKELVGDFKNNCIFFQYVTVEREHLRIVRSMFLLLFFKSSISGSRRVFQEPV